ARLLGRESADPDGRVRQPAGVAGQQHLDARRRAPARAAVSQPPQARANARLGRAEPRGVVSHLSDVRDSLPAVARERAARASTRVEVTSRRSGVGPYRQRSEPTESTEKNKTLCSSCFRGPDLHLVQFDRSLLRSASAPASTAVPRAIAVGDAYSSGRWLMPPRHGMNTI